MFTYTSPVATMIKKNPRKMRRHVSCFLSKGCERPPQAPAHRQQHTHKLVKQSEINYLLNHDASNGFPTSTHCAATLFVTKL